MQPNLPSTSSNPQRPSTFPARPRQQLHGGLGTSGSFQRALFTSLDRNVPMRDRILKLQPVPMPFENLEKLEEKTVIELCGLGRDVTHEIQIRIHNVLSLLRSTDKQIRTTAAQDLEAILAHARFLFQKLVEIRVRIDKIRASANVSRMDEDTFIKHITDPSDPEEPTSSTKQALIEQYENNRVKVIEMSTKLKKLEWVGTIQCAQSM